MAYIKVDRADLRNAAEEIERYIRKMKIRDLMKLDNSIDQLGEFWGGEDYAQFRAKWETLKDKDSGYQRSLNMLQSYANFPRKAESDYYQEQVDSVNRCLQALQRR